MWIIINDRREKINFFVKIVRINTLSPPNWELIRRMNQTVYVCVCVFTFYQYLWINKIYFRFIVILLQSIVASVFASLNFIAYNLGK